MKQSDLVLVVEDDLEIRESLVEILEETGYRAIGAKNGLDALAQLRAMPALPSLILLDLMMPMMDGLAFRRQQLSEPAIADVPAVLISAHSNVTPGAEELRFAHHMRKPINLDQLLAVAAQHCTRNG
ncbi:MAG TPA: response regulator [Polyangia bacterium]